MPGDPTVGKTSGKFLGDKKHKSQTRKEREREVRSHIRKKNYRKELIQPRVKTSLNN